MKPKLGSSITTTRIRQKVDLSPCSEAERSAEGFNLKLQVNFTSLTYLSKIEFYDDFKNQILPKVNFLLHIKSIYQLAKPSI